MTKTMIKKIKKQAGFTLMEILVAAGIFAMITTIMGTTMINLYQAQRKERITSELYEESRFLMERIVKEARVSTIDYEEYFSKSVFGDHPASTTYGENPRAYEKRFWRVQDLDTPNEVLIKNEGFFNTKANNIVGLTDDDPNENAIDNYSNQELYLISPDGKTKTIIKRINNGIDDDYDGSIDEDPFGDINDDGDDDDDLIADGKIDEDGSEIIAIAKMVASDSNTDGTLDAWTPHPDFVNTSLTSTTCNDEAHYWIDNACLEFISITHPLLTIENLTFYVAPLDDPRKAFNEDDEDVQMQPHVTISFQSRTNRETSNTLINFIPRISLQTTVSPRVYHNVLFP